MTTRIARFSMIAAAFLGLAGTSAFAEDRFRDLNHDYAHLGRIDNHIREDRRELRDDREDGRYFQAARERSELRRDYSERRHQVRDIRHDRWER